MLQTVQKKNTHPLNELLRSCRDLYSSFEPEIRTKVSGIDWDRVNFCFPRTNEFWFPLESLITGFDYTFLLAFSDTPDECYILVRETSTECSVQELSTCLL